MQGQYPSKHRSRPRPCEAAERVDAIPARFFLCARCRAQVLICRCCDRGQIYCAGSCAPEARRSAQRAAGRRYQSSHRGRLAHASRARRYRARQKNVTHQGSLQPPTDGLLAPGSVVAPSPPDPRLDAPPRPPWRCHWCGRRCPQLVRNGFLRRRRGFDP